MIYEFAIEPDLVATWGHLSEYRFFFDKFGLGTARIMSEFPKFKNWRRQLLRVATGANDLELERITALIYILSEKMISRQNVQYDGSISCSWLENAEKEDERFPFHAILASSNPRENSRVLSEKTLGTSYNLKWNVKKQIIIPRKANEMAVVMSVMLRNCNTAIFVDPYFLLPGNQTHKWKKTFGAFFKELSKNRSISSQSQFRVEVHASAEVNKAPSSDFFKDQCIRCMSNYIPDGLSVCFKRWNQKKPGGKKLHDRYILTDLGGVDFSIGLDEGFEGEDQKLTLMERGIYNDIWSRYASNHPAFDLDTDSVIVIEGKSTA